MAAFTSLTLNPDELIAKAFWLLHTKSAVDTAYLLSEMSDVIADHDPGEEDLAEQEMERRLKVMKYATNLEALGKLYDLLKAHHAGFWGGRYGVLDSGGGIHRLVLDDTHVTFYLGGSEQVAVVASDAGAFTGQKLTIDNDAVSLTVTFATASDGVVLGGDSDVDVARLATIDTPTLHGTLVIKSGPRAGTFDVRGKRDAYTAAAIAHASQTGEPLSTWVGTYSMRYTDDNDPAWTWYDEPLTVAMEGATPIVHLGDTTAVDVQYLHNRLSFEIPGKDSVSKFALQLSCTTQGTRRFFGQININGRDRSLTGYATGRHGFWLGVYGVLDSAGDLHRLIIRDGDASFVLNGSDAVHKASSDDFFTGQPRVLATDAVAVTYAADVAAGAAADVALLTGTLVIKQGPGAGTRTFQAKRDTYTVAGVKDAQHPGEPLSTWLGEYVLRTADSIPSTALEESLVIADDEGTPAVTLGATRATGVRYRGNRLWFTIARDGKSSSYDVRLSSTPDGRLRLRADVVTEGSSHPQTLTGVFSKPKPVAAVHAVARATLRSTPATARLAAAAALGGPSDPVDFCDTSFDFVINAATDLRRETPSEDAKDKLPASGYVVEEVVDGKATGRKTVWTFADEAQPWAPGALVDYQPLDSAYEPKPGYLNTQLGYKVDKVFELQSLVETDYYELRLSIINYVLPDGVDSLSIVLAKDAPQQPHLIEFEKCTVKTCGEGTGGYSISHEDNAETGLSHIEDLRKATVLVRGATGETQIAGFHHYVAAVTPAIKATRTRYSVDDKGKTVEGPAETVDVPLLFEFKIMMDSRDAIELSGTEWPPAVLDRPYRAHVSAQRGIRPYTWTLVTAGGLPDDLKWGTDGTNSYGITDGTLGLNALRPGTVCAPVIAVTNAPKAVMKPSVLSLSVSIAQPEQESKQVTDWMTWVFDGLAVTPIALLAMRWLWNKGKDKLSDDGKDTVELSGDAYSKTAKKLGRDLKDLVELTAKAQTNAKTQKELANQVKELRKLAEQMNKELQELRDRRAKAETEGDRAEARVLRQLEKRVENEKESSSSSEYEVERNREEVKRREESSEGSGE